MSVSFDAIFNQFSKESIEVFPKEYISTLFTDAKLLASNQTVFDKDIIYVGRTSTFEKLIDKFSQNTFILTNDNHLDCSYFSTKRLNIIEVKNSEDIFELFNRISDLFLEDELADQNTSILLKSAFSGNGIDGIIEVAYSLLKNPLIFIDSNYKILAHSDIKYITDKLWLENLKSQYCTYDFIAGVKKLKSVQNGLKENQIFQVMCPMSTTLKLVSNVRIDGKHFGSIILLICNKPYTSVDMDLLSLTSKIIGEEMKKNKFYRNAVNIAYSELIYDILEGRLNNTQLLKERIKSGDLAISKNLTVLAIDISNYKSANTPNNYLQDNFSLYFPSNNTVYYKDNIIIFCDFDKFNINSKNFNSFIEFLKLNRLKVGISKPFSSILYCKKYYEQAIRALELDETINSQKPYVFYSDIQLYDVISLTSSKIDYRDFYHPALIKLKNYDSKNNSDLFNTLYTFLKNNQNLLKTSSELFIHRNTTSYRLKKILELVNIDFSCSDTTFNLMLSYKIMAYPNLTNNNFE